MSVIAEGYPTPNMVVAVFKYLKQKKRTNPDALHNMLSPIELIKSEDGKRKSLEEDQDDEISQNKSKDIHWMIKLTLNECKSMGLLVQTISGIEINPLLVNKNEADIPSVICDLFFSRIKNVDGENQVWDEKENHDFLRVCSWYLAQNCQDAPANWKEAEKLLNEQFGNYKLGMNSVRYPQFEYWFCYLGFGWRHSVKGTKRVTVPDPTLYLKRNLEVLFESRKELPIIEFMDKLAKHSPVFEFGSFRTEIEQKIGGRDPNQLSSVTSMALFRLQEEGFIKLNKESDADVLVLPDGGEGERITHIMLLEKNNDI